LFINFCYLIFSLMLCLEGFGGMMEGVEEAGAASSGHVAGLGGVRELLGRSLEEALYDMYAGFDMDVYVDVRVEPLPGRGSGYVNVYVDVILGARYDIGEGVERHARRIDPARYCEGHGIPEDICEEEVRRAAVRAVEGEVEWLNSEYANLTEGEIRAEGFGRRLTFKVSPAVCGVHGDAVCYAGLSVRIVIEDARLDSLRRHAKLIADYIARAVHAVANLRLVPSYAGLKLQ